MAEQPETTEPPAHEPQEPNDTLTEEGDGAADAAETEQEPAEETPEA